MTGRPAVIGVVDLRAGLAVHATGGDRRVYAPLATAGGRPLVSGCPEALARYYTEDCGVTSIYVADLEAISGGAWQADAIRTIASRASIWLDAGVTTPAAADRARTSGAARVVVGLETLDSFASLAAICERTGAEAVAFSLDLRDGRPLTTGALAVGSPEEIARRAQDAGATAVIVLDLAHVGRRAGPAFAAVERVRRAVPSVTLVAGGGVRDEQDLRRLGDLGCDAALVATALLDGTLRA